ncbi:MAG: hypothetical protein HQL36_09265 [Alphaproteobacteria bacterium]|nr:hypothetical protein [Alphaproteobacteria bacterium]MBF0251620.1 hypothetical protein [Alphaproteobacteria bacterium]
MFELFLLWILALFALAFMGFVAIAALKAVDCFFSVECKADTKTHIPSNGCVA